MEEIKRKHKKLFNSHPNATTFAYIVNASISILALILCSPLIILISIAIKFQDGGNVLYRGERYGYKKKKFTMYKFRTLVPNAEELIGARLLRPGEGLETGIGKFLRDTRLDELPQLFNIINGSMAFIGPRPERPAVYEKMCREIKEYDKRFNIKPGVFGYSQLFTPHSTGKRMRAYIDNYYAQGDNYFAEIRLVIYAFFILGISLHRKAFKVVANKIKMFCRARRINNLRRFERRVHSEKKVSVEIWYSVDNEINKIQTRIDLKDPDAHVSLININEEALLVITAQPILLSSSDSALIKITIHTGNVLECKEKIKTAYCKLIECVQLRDGYRYLLAYKSISSLNQYKVEKYLLNKSVV